MEKLKELLKNVFLSVIIVAMFVTNMQIVALGAETVNESSEQKKADDALGEDLMPSTGEVKSLVFLVDFPDLKQTDGTTAETKKEQLFDLEDVSSLSGFYYASSYGKLKLDGDVYGYYTVEHPSDYYKDAFGQQELIKEVLEYYDEVIDYSDYDSDKDGIIDSLYFEHVCEETEPYSFWSTYVTYWSEDTVPLVGVDGMSINAYAWIQSKNGDLLNVYKHETGHLLGLMDYYDVSTRVSDGSIGTSDMMSNNDGDHNAYTKMLLGWLEPKVVSDVTELELRSSQLYPDAAIIYPNKDTTSDEFFVIEYITSDGVNYARQSRLRDGGIRVWRVNAHKDESGGFIYRNIEGAIHFIEAVGPCDMSLSDENSRVWDGKGQVTTANIYFEGDELTPYSNPSSYIHGERETDMSPLESATGPFESSGIVMNNIRIDDGKAKVDISYDFSVRDDFNYDIEYTFESMLLAELTFEYDTTVLDASKITVSNGEKELDIEVEINCVPTYGYKKLYIFSESKELKEEGVFTLKIEEGALINLFGKYNPVITEELHIKNIDASIEKEYILADDAYITDLISIDDKGYIFFERDDAIWMSQIYQGKNGIESKDIKVLECSNNPYIYADKVDGMLLLHVYDSKGDNYLYSVNTDGTCKLIQKIECSGWAQMYVLGDNCLFYDYTSILRLVNVSSGQVKEINASDAWALNAIWDMQQGLYIADYERRLVIVDSQFNVIKEVTKESFNLGNTENIAGFIIKNENLVMLSVEESGVHTDLYMTYLDENYNVLSKKKYLNDSLWGIQYNNNDLIENENGYAIKMRLTDSFMMRFTDLFVESYNYVFDMCKISFFDKNMNYIASKIFWETDISKISIEKIGEKWVYSYLCNDGSMKLSVIDEVPFESNEERISDVSLNRNNVTLSVGQTYRLYETYEPYDIQTECIWKSSNEAVAVVDSNGYITALGVGETTITAMVNGVSASCVINVNSRISQVIIDISKCDVSEVADQIYTGSVICPTPVIKYYDSVLIEGVDYTLGYSDNMNIGTATITIDGIGNYKGTYSITFDIVYGSGMYKGADGQWYYYTNGKVDTSYTGLAKNAYGWWYMNKGKLDTSYTGLVKYKSNWVYVVNGKLNSTYTGLVKYKSNWVYVNKGKLDATYTGLVKYKSNWVYVSKGKLNSTYTGLVKYKSNWVYVNKGKLDASYTGLVKYKSNWVYVNKGKLDTSFTGMAKNPYGWWYVTKGKLDLTFTGIAKNAYGTWYLQKGKLDLTFSGKVTVDGVKYTIKNGKVK